MANEHSDKPAVSANRPTIYRVHGHLRGINKGAYTPETVAIGPYHRKAKNLRAMEKHKERYVDEILKHRKQEIGIYISAIEELEVDARKWYAEPIGLSPKEFTKMLVYDGCFIIELLRRKPRASDHKKKDPIFQMAWMINSIQRDLLLFENQIPFFVLLKLMSLIEAEGSRGRLFYFVFRFWKNFYPAGQKWKHKEYLAKENNIKHLLDLLHRFCSPPSTGDHVPVDVDPMERKAPILLGLLPRFCAPSSGDHVAVDVDPTERKALITNSATKPTAANVKTCLHDLLPQLCSPPSTGDHVPHDVDPVDEEEKFMRRDEFIIKSATKLKTANVKFKEIKGFKEKDSMMDMDFETPCLRHGIMRMRALTIEDRTECLFRNLIAYEQYSCYNQPHYVSDYARLLNCLIDSPTDVDLLSKSGIINNLLGDDDVVATMINQLTQTISPNEELFIYAETFEKINCHYKMWWNRSCAVLKRDYFGSAWSCIAVLVATFVVLLTVLQAVCGVKEAFL